jgi:hypothetical protein
MRQAGSHPSHAAVTDTLIHVGVAESAIADALFPGADGLDPIAAALRSASGALGHALWHTWRNRPEDAALWWARGEASLLAAEVFQLPAAAEISIPEGYAYYAVYPEAYLEAAVRCRGALGTRAVVCLGLRSIGTSLSAAVVGGLEEMGCKVASYTVRPRGHPFSRRPVLTDDLEQTLRAAADAAFLLIDEGPGISGSSLGGAADLLSGLGIPDDQIILLPSWRTAGDGLGSAVARAHWPRHPQFIASFEEIWLDTGRLTSACPPGRLRDISAGQWRQRTWASPTHFPPVQPQHERRKYLLEPDDAGAQSLWLSFAGLGGRAEAQARRAEELAAAGFTPAPVAAIHGFLLRRFVPGRPTSSTHVDPILIDTVAAYLAHLSCEYPAEPSTGGADLMEMTEVNVSEGLGASLAPVARCEVPVALDGRMFAHEWIRTGQGFLKTDAWDHHDDHFFPGCEDIAWDLVGACIEMGLTVAQRRRLIERYRRLSHDRTIAARLPGYAVSYLAFRLGYSTMAVGALGTTPDGLRFARAAGRYRRLLRHELSLSGACWG